MATGTHDLAGGISAVDFRIAFGAAQLSTDKQNVDIPFIGVGNPARNADLSMYDYSVDSGATWLPMTVVAGTPLTGLAFSTAGTSHTFVWAARIDVGSDLFNNNIKVRLQADGGVVLTDIAIFNLYFARSQQNISLQDQGSQFPDDYSGVPGDTLLANAPKPI